MSRPSNSILGIKERAYRQIEIFNDNPHFLPSLKYAHYRAIPKGSHYHDVAFRKARAARIKEDYERLTHRPHVMHAQHRKNCVKVLQFLCKSVDITTLECLMVAPRYKRARPLYVAEIALKTDIAKRTVQECLLSLTTAGYIDRYKDTLKNFSKVRRHKFENKSLRHRIFMTPKFFDEIECDVARNIIVRKMFGLAKKEYRQSKKYHTANKPQSVSPSHKVFDAIEVKSYKKTDEVIEGYEKFKKDIGRNTLKPPD